MDLDLFQRLERANAEIEHDLPVVLLTPGGAGSSRDDGEIDVWQYIGSMIHDRYSLHVTDHKLRAKLDKHFRERPRLPALLKVKEMSPDILGRGHRRPARLVTGYSL